MVPLPIQRLQVARASNATGIMTQVTHLNTDTYATLLSATGLEKEGLFFEPNSECLMNAPSVLWEDLVQDDWTFSAPTEATGGKWRTVTDRALGVQMFSQYDGAVDREWTAESDPSFLTENCAFSVKMQIGPPPKGATHDRENYYRHVIFPSDSLPGEVRYRFALHYGEAPRLEYSVDGGSLYKRIGDIPSAVDLAALRSGKNVEVTLTFMQLDGKTIVWLGDLNRHTLYHRQDGIEVGETKGGRLGFAGKNGIQTYAFGRIVFRRIGRYHSYALPGPNDMSRAPGFVIQPETPRTEGVSVSGKIESIDRRRREFTYTLELQGPPLDEPNDDFSLTTPLVRQVTIVHPPKWSSPPKAGWQDVGGINRIKEYQSLDLKGGMRRRAYEVALDNREGQRALQGGVQAMQLFLGYAHTGSFPRGRALGNMRFTMTEAGDESEMTFEAEDLLYILARQPLKDDIYPSQWCVYTLAHLLLEHGGIVPDLQRTFPRCQVGPNPANCPHTKMPAHPGWKTPRMVLSCLEEVRQVIAGIMGQDIEGQFRFEPFDFAPRRRPQKAFYEAGTRDFGIGGGALNEIFSLTRRRNLDDLRNDLHLIGFEQTTGQVFLRHLDNVLTLRSKFDPSYAGYLGFAAPLIHESSIYATREFTEYVAQKLLSFIALPGEFVEFSCWGQPTVFPGDIIEVNMRRSVGRGVRYFVEEIVSTWESGIYLSTIKGRWATVGSAPGYSR